MSREVVAGIDLEQAYRTIRLYDAWGVPAWATGSNGEYTVYAEE